MHDVIWIGRPGAGDKAAMLQMFENVRFADACSPVNHGDVSEPSNQYQKGVYTRAQTKICIPAKGQQAYRARAKTPATMSGVEF